MAPGTLAAYPPVEVAPAGEADGKSVLRNGGFEEFADNTFAHWELRTDNGIEFAHDADYCADGEHALRVAGLNHRSFRLHQSVENIGHTHYALTCLVLPRAASGTITLRAWVGAGNEQVLLDQHVDLSKLKPAWNRVLGDFEVSATTKTFSVGFEYTPPAADLSADSSLWLDDATLNVLSTPYHENLLTNGDFANVAHNSLPDWEWWRDHAITHGSGAEFAHFLSVQCREGQGITFRRLLKDILKPQETYTIRGYIRTHDARGNAFIEIAKEGGDTLVSTAPAQDEEWRQVSAQFTAPDDVGDLMILLRYTTAPDAPAVSVDFANVELFVTKPSRE